MGVVGRAEVDKMRDARDVVELEIAAREARASLTNERYRDIINQGRFLVASNTHTRDNIVHLALSTIGRSRQIAEGLGFQAVEAPEKTRDRTRFSVASNPAIAQGGTLALKVVYANRQTSSRFRFWDVFEEEGLEEALTQYVGVDDTHIAVVDPATDRRYMTVALSPGEFNAQDPLIQAEFSDAAFPLRHGITPLMAPYDQRSGNTFHATHFTDADLVMASGLVSRFNGFLDTMDEWATANTSTPQ